MPTDHVHWSAYEIEDTVHAYAEVFARVKTGEPVVKRDAYRALSQRYGGRKLSAYARRFSNISHLLLEMGLERMPGLGPQGNMGPRAESIIKTIIEERGYFGYPASTLLAPARSVFAPRLPARPAGNRQPPRRQVTVEQTVRDQAVVDWVLAQAAGRCECCGQPAPFLREDGTPYLEVHHVKWLAQGGSDTVSNAVALCPNCHRQLHHGAGAVGLMAQLVLRVERLVAE
jgi:5-methylcytosine-specific restriction protein A